MRTTRLITAIIVLVLLTACATPRIKLFTDAAEPLMEYTLEGRAPESVLLISVQGTISDTPQKGLVRSSPSTVEQYCGAIEEGGKG